MYSRIAFHLRKEGKKMEKITAVSCRAAEEAGFLITECSEGHEWNSWSSEESHSILSDFLFLSPFPNQAH
jgi:hypothetical protein